MTRYVKGSWLPGMGDSMQRNVWTPSRVTLGRQLCLIFLLMPYALGQTTTGTIVGSVTDQTGAVVSQAAIVITEEGTGARRTLTTNAQGEYIATLLPIGT